MSVLTMIFMGVLLVLLNPTNTITIIMAQEQDQAQAAPLTTATSPAAAEPIAVSDSEGSEASNVAASPACVNGTALLSQNEELTSTLATILQEYQEEFESQCSTSSSSSTECNVTFGATSSTSSSTTLSSYEEQCDQLGGQIYQYPVTFPCGVPPLTTTTDLGFVPQCIAMECTTTISTNTTSTTTTTVEGVILESITNFVSTLNEEACPTMTMSPTTNYTSIDMNYTNYTSIPSESSVPSMAPTMAPTYEGGISPECANGTAALDAIPELTGSLDALLQGYNDDFKAACPFTLTNSQCSVTFGSSPQTGNGTYWQLCEEQEGQIYDNPIVLQCGVPPLDTKTDLGVVPHCIAMACNVSAPQFDASLITSETIDNFASSLNNGGCKAKVESSAPRRQFTIGRSVGGTIGLLLASSLWMFVARSL